MKNELLENALQKSRKYSMITAIKGEIIVADSSTDRTGTIAKSLGAQVIQAGKKRIRECLSYRIQTCTGSLHRYGRCRQYI